MSVGTQSRGCAAAPRPPVNISIAYLCSAGSRSGGNPFPAAQVMICPVSASRPVRLARARLLGVVAAVLPDFAYLRAHTSIALHLHVQPGSQQQVQPRDAIFREGNAESLHAAIGILHHHSRVVVVLLRAGASRASARGEKQHEAEYSCKDPGNHV